MINGFSSIARQYFCEFEITYKDDHTKDHADMVAINLDTGEMTAQAKNITANYVDLIYLPKTQDKQSDLEIIFEKYLWWNVIWFVNIPIFILWELFSKFYIFCNLYLPVPP